MPNAVIMSHETWMQLTYLSMTSQRSSKMKAIDTALKAYWSSDRSDSRLRAIYIALNRWMEEKTSAGTDWKKSARNVKYQAVETLYGHVYSALFPSNKQTTRPILGRRSGDDGLGALREAQQTAAKRLFGNAQLELKSSYAKNHGFSNMESRLTKLNIATMYKGAVAIGAPSVQTDARAIRQGVMDAERGIALGVHDAASSVGLARSGGGGSRSGVSGAVSSAAASARQTVERLTVLARQKFQSLVAMHIPATVLSDVLGWLHSSGCVGAFIGEIVGAMIPFHGAVLSGGTALFSAFKASRDAYRQYYLTEHAKFVLPGDASEAVSALYEVMERSYTTNASSAKLGAAQCAAQVVLQALDVSGATGAIVGAAVAIINISRRLTRIGIDFLETHNANKRLAKPETIDMRIFEVSPILGAYFILGTETSSMLNYLPNFGKAGWMSEVEWLNKNHIQPLKEQALIYAKESRFHLVSTSGRNSLEQRFVTDSMQWRTEIEKSIMSPDEYKKRFGGPLPSDFKARIKGTSYADALSIKHTSLSG